MSPSVIQFAYTTCSLGTVLVARSETGVCAISLGDSALQLIADLNGQFPDHQIVESIDDVRSELQRVADFIEEPSGPLDIKLDLNGSDFQKRVWTALADSTPGQTLTYRQLAQQLGDRSASRAVGTACGQNRIAIAIPCHRVVRSDGKDSGYRWGIERKRELLHRERSLAHNDLGLQYD
ncbi:methylated-DNA--[protein]-cysteine S-methyltransferase [Rhodopirellula halodulae]|uniref:methylated-DNA--[protein]-cysteine S-methyltransferase n=1 Tax=Rhodopirellula halodulae TaxID=2894198 RepID=UPI001E441CC4|nr:methylated-DNA--[protein]-cysteine S-methyltransferase [Rhodopirellula sp. JC737]MCC9656598.1 methylated-DNA--[protein]-cysteine S-methyltransferase [Rhodopirellula sp. JC737]